MTLNEAYIEYFKGLLDSLKANGVMAQDITYSVHDEFYYEHENDADFVIKVLPGEITKDLVQYPIQIMVDIIDDKTAELRGILDDLAVQLNEKSIRLDNVSYKQFYSTSAILSTFSNGGVNKYNSIYLNVTLIKFTNVLGLDTLSINTTGVTGPLVSYSINYEVETESTGAIGSAESKSVGKTFIRTWSFVFVPNTTNAGVNAIINQIKGGTSPNTTFSLAIKFKSDSATSTADYVIKSGTIDQEMTGLPLLRVILCKRM